MMAKGRPLRFGTAQEEAQARRDLRAQVTRLEQRIVVLKEVGQKLRAELADSCPGCREETLLHEWDAALACAGEGEHTAQVIRLEGEKAALAAALNRYIPENLAHRADGLKECRYCHALVSLGPHKPDCPRAALSGAGEGEHTAQVARLEGRNAALEVALRGLDTFITDLAESGDSGDWEPTNYPEVVKARTALSGAGEGKPKDHYCPDCAYWHNIEMETARRGWLEVAKMAAMRLRDLSWFEPNGTLHWCQADDTSTKEEADELCHSVCPPTRAALDALEVE